MPKTEVLIFKMHEEETLVHDILAAGARGYLLKSDAKTALVAAIQSLALRRPFFTARVSEALLHSFVNEAGGSRMQSEITARERGVLQLIAEGHTSKQIANVLNTSVKTVEAHRASLRRKLEVMSSASLVRYAIRNKLLEVREVASGGLCPRAAKRALTDLTNYKLSPYKARYVSRVHATFWTPADAWHFTPRRSGSRATDRHAIATSRLVEGMTPNAG
jgi:DNA-binding CsgD family transcriptional regulator